MKRTTRVFSDPKNRRIPAFFIAAVLVILCMVPAASAQQAGVSFSLSSAAGRLAPGESLTLRLTASCAGTLLVTDAESGEPLGSAPAPEGQAAIEVPLSRDGAPLSPGAYRISLTLEGESGERSASRSFTIRIEGGEGAPPAPADGGQEDSVEPPASQPDDIPGQDEDTQMDDPSLSGRDADGPSAEVSPAPLSPWSLTPAPAKAQIGPLQHFTLLDDEDSISLEHPVYAGELRASAHEKSYWTMQLGDLSDEKAIWDIMMQPITVLDDHKHSAKESYKLRVTPDSSTARSNVAGEITYRSQGVHVVENLDSGWSLVEAYNSSYGDTYKKDGRVVGYGKTGELIRGYVKTDVLMQVNPKEDYGLLIDKYTQTMYIFSAGKIIGSLLVSTGKVNASQPWNETPAGEFVIVSWTGGFWAGNLYCDMGLLLNNGCLIHEVPALVKDQESGFKDFSTTVPYLGQKASHGCIRVQRAKNEEGQNMRWLWDNLSINTKVLIWEDSTRYTNYPDDSLVLYYNPVGGNRYHLKQYCSSVNQRYHPLSALTYGELTEAYYKDLVPCQSCTPPDRPETILQQNLDNGYPY